MRKRILIIPYIPIIIGIATAEIYIVYSCYGGLNMDTVSAIAIVVAIIGAASGIWAQVVQFKKDAKRIDDVTKSVNDVNNSVGTVKSDTNETKPTIININENVKKIRDEVVEKIVPDMHKLGGVDTLVEAYKIEQAIKKNNSPNIYDRDILKGTIDIVYEENARLQIENQEKKRELHQAKLEIDRLQKKIGSLSLELSQYQPPKRNHSYDLER